MPQKSKKPICAICGKRPATTVDHIPPKGVFSKPRPANLITVPACFHCNHGASKNDEKFRVYLSLHVGIDTPEKKSLWDDHALRSVRHNNRLRQEILQKMAPVEINTPSGIVLGKRTAVLWNSKSHDSVIERTIRGLYYHHYHVTLGSQAQVKVQWLHRLDNNVYEQTKHWHENDIGKGALIYKYGRAEDAPLNSFWVFQFYGSHWASGYTIPTPVAEPIFAPV